MQTSALLYRGGRVLRRLTVALGLLAAPAGAHAGGFDFCHAWDRGRAGARFPAEPVTSAPDCRTARGLFVHASLSCPHGLPDLLLHAVRLGLRGGRGEVRLTWASLGHPLYREDRLELACGVTPDRVPLRVGIRPVLSFRSIPGFPQERGASCSLVTATGGRYSSLPVQLGAECSLGSHGDPPSFRSAVRASLSLGGLSVIVNLVERRQGRELRFAARASLAPGLFMDAGFRAPPHETSLGVELDRRGIRCWLGWSHHPDLGKTLSTGIGWRWFR